MNQLFISSLLITTLSACGGGGGSAPVGNNNSGGDNSGGDNGGNTTPESPSYEVGRFVDSAVNGLHYKTATLEGLTNADGEFKYNSGETVTFSLGATVLGEAIGSDIVTPFSLFDVLPPTQEHVIAAALSNNKAVQTLDKALNIAMLLQNLDVDGNPSNGIDLGDAHAELSNTRLDFASIKATRFIEDSAIAAARRSLNISSPLVLAQSAAEHLYDNLNVQVVAADIGNTSGSSGLQETFSTNTEYNEDGLPILEEIDNNGDGLIDITIRYQYNDGLLTEKSNSKLQVTEYLTYNGQRQLIERLSEHDNGNASKESYSYIGNTIQRFSLDSNNDGTPNRVVSYEYDDQEQKIATRIDIDGNGTIDSVSNAAYYPDGRQATYTEDDNNDGTPNLVIAYTYDANGNRSGFNITIDENAFPAETSLFTYTGALVKEYFVLDENYRLKFKEIYSYDSQDRRTGVLKDSNGDGTQNIRIQYKYDLQGNRTLIAEDNNRDGVADKVWRRTVDEMELSRPWSKIFSQL